MVENTLSYDAHLAARLPTTGNELISSYPVVVDKSPFTIFLSRDLLGTRKSEGKVLFFASRVLTPRLAFIIIKGSGVVCGVGGARRWPSHDL